MFISLEFQCLYGEIKWHIAVKSFEKYSKTFSHLFNSLDRKNLSGETIISLIDIGNV